MSKKKNIAAVAYVHTAGFSSQIEITEYLEKAKQTMQNSLMYKQGNLELFIIPVREKETELVFFNL